ncbi:hypothetical protein A2876_03945 [Candidatus Amesbacteria bacterium RIFCSPHIGHO2_01_FULL_48_32b]|uniref:DUF5658 domain-containing protein n=1 Tax=Candidatus Amesbacteria bacterium RIFCSPHIGHO2_01_FULL_48_32b TaxID=1797253 RepID=A0A1F4YD31_9BACT|nr:MAG: hypothetical protein A2876_03945 [Candidatus Amesbacteria bacterium RIFCSPHIGHO2_01_FULL_48_32b]
MNNPAENPQKNNLKEDAKEAVTNFLQSKKDGWEKLSSGERIYATNIGVLILMGVADVVTTHVFLSMGYQESNPIARFGIEKIGELATLALGLSRLAVPIALFEFVRKQNHIKEGNLSLRLCNSAYAAVVFTNAITPFVLPK